MAQARHARRSHTQADMPSGEQNGPGEQHPLANSAVPDANKTPSDTPDLHALALGLIAELSACVQRVSSDLAQTSTQAGDLEAARQRWAQQLRALANMAEDCTPDGASLLPSEMPLSALPPYPRRNATTQPITVATRIPVASPDAPDAPGDEQISREMPINPPLPASYRWVPLTAREREVLKLTQRGYSPRRIALRLTITVETVYTHTRNIRRKQRAWEQEWRERLAQQAHPTQEEQQGEQAATAATTQVPQ